MAHRPSDYWYVVRFRPVFGPNFLNVGPDHGSSSATWLNFGLNHPERFEMVTFALRTGSKDRSRKFNHLSFIILGVHCLTNPNTRRIPSCSTTLSNGFIVSPNNLRYQSRRQQGRNERKSQRICARKFNNRTFKQGKIIVHSLSANGALFQLRFTLVTGMDVGI